jgi:hypothetical protein
VRRLFVLLVVLALGGAASPEHSSEGLIYCGLGTGRPTYLPSFYVDPGLYGIGMGGAAGPTSISLCAVYGATAKVVLLAPHGATIALDRPAGTNIGTLYAKVQVGKRSINLPRPLASIVTADPLRYVHNACVPGRHAAVWLLRARSADDAVRLALPIYLDPVAGGAYRLQLCFGSPNGKRRIVGWPARATFRLLTLTIDQRVLGEAPTEPAAYVWHGFFTPFRADGSTHAAATVEARATQLLPVAWTLAGTYDAGIGAARIAGSLLQGGERVAGLQLVLWYGTALGGDFPGIVTPSRAAAQTDAAGRFAAAVPITRTTYVRASGGTVLHYARCMGRSSAPKGCVSASTSGFAGASAIAAVPVP